MSEYVTALQRTPVVIREPIVVYIPVVIRRVLVVYIPLGIWIFTVCKPVAGTDHSESCLSP
jgi:hypothetical protein